MAKSETRASLITSNPRDRVMERIREKKEEFFSQKARDKEREREEKKARSLEREKKKETRKGREFKEFQQVFAEQFISLADRYFGFTRLGDLREGFTDDELLELEKEIASRAWSDAVLQRVFFWTPVGLLCYGLYHCFVWKDASCQQHSRRTHRPSRALTYRYLRGRLQKLSKVLGEDWFPYFCVRRGY